MNYGALKNTLVKQNAKYLTKQKNYLLISFWLLVSMGEKLGKSLWQLLTKMVLLDTQRRPECGSSIKHTFLYRYLFWCTFNSKSNTACRNRLVYRHVHWISYTNNKVLSNVLLTLQLIQKSWSVKIKSVKLFFQV